MQSGNLGRAGYGATTEGLWPYSYDTCDWGTLPGQVFPAPGDPNAQPSAALTTGPGGGVLSGAPGQRFSACTCGNANDGDGPMGHPGPKRGDGFVGRMAPEIDILEASSCLSCHTFVRLNDVSVHHGDGQEPFG